MVSIVDLMFFWQPGSINNVSYMHYCHVFESTKYLRLFLKRDVILIMVRDETGD